MLFGVSSTKKARRFGAGRFVRFSAISIAYGRFMFACWLTLVYFNIFTNNVNKKMTKKALFFAHHHPHKPPPAAAG